MRTAFLMDRLPQRLTVLLVLGLGAFGSGLSIRHGAAAQQSLPLSPGNKDPIKTDNDKMFPDGLYYNFGKVKTGTPVNHAFRIVNTSNLPLQINSVRVSMAPMSAWAAKDVLQPNEEGKVEISVDTRRFYGLKTMALYVTTKQGRAIQEFRFVITGISEHQP